MRARAFFKTRLAKVVGLVVLALAPSSVMAKEAKKKTGSSRTKSSRSVSSSERSKSSEPAVSADAPFSKVVLDAGHGGHDPGGIPSNLIPEKGVALDVTLRVANHLRSAGIPVVLTRTDDTFISLPDRVAVANSHDDSIFVSVHFNSGQRVGARGIETFYHKSSVVPLAKRMQRNLMSVAGGDDRGVKRGTFYVLRNTKTRGILVECGFLTNPEDAALAGEANYRERLASQISSAIIEYHRAVNRTANTNLQTTATTDLKDLG